MFGTAEAYWSAKSLLLRRISDRIANDTTSPAVVGNATVGTAFAAVIDLAFKSMLDYGWVPEGIAEDSTPVERRLRRGTRILFSGGEQEQCPGGPGENILYLRVERDGSASPSGQFGFPYDLRCPFGANLAEHLLVGFGEPVLADPDRLGAIAIDVARLIAEATPLAFGAYHGASGMTFGEIRG